MTRTLLRRLGRGVVARPWWARLAVLAVTAVALLLLPSFRIESDVSTLFPADHEAVALRRLAAADATSPCNMLVVVHGRDLDRRLVALVEDLRASPFLEEVVATQAEFAATRGARRAAVWHLPEESLGLLARRLAGPERQDAVRSLRRRIAQDPLLGLELARRDPLRVREVLDDARRRRLPDSLDPDARHLVLRSGGTAFLHVRGRREPYDMEFTRDLLADLEERLAGQDHDLLGGYSIARADEARLKGDLKRSALGSFVLVTLFLMASTRHLLLPLAIALPVATAVLWALAFGGALLGPLTPLAAASAAILAGLGVDFGIHWYGRYCDERQGAAHGAAVAAAHERTGRPMGTAMATSAAAFLSLGVSGFHGLWSVGALLALGLLCSLVVTLVLLPTLVPRAARPRPASPVMGLLDRLVHGRAARPALVAVVALAAGGWTATAVHGIGFDADMRRLRPADDPVLEGVQRLERQLGFAPVPVAVLVPASVPVERLASGVAGLRREGWIATSAGPHHSLPTAAGRQRVRAFRDRIDGWVEGALEDLAAAGFAPGEIRPALEDLDARLHQDPAVDPAHHRVTWRGSPWWLMFLYPERTPWNEADRRALRAAVVGAFPGDVRWTATIGMADDLTPLLAGGLLDSAACAAVIVVLVVLVSLRRLRAAAVAMLPVLSGLGITLGILASTGWVLHLGNFAAIPLILGIGIDDGIHLVARSREPGGAGTRSLLHGTGRSIWRTTATTALAFGSLMLAESPGLVSLGMLLTVGVAVCLLTSVLVVPLLGRDRDDR